MLSAGPVAGERTRTTEFDLLVCPRRTAATTWRNGGTRSGQQSGRRASEARLDTRGVLRC